MIFGIERKGAGFLVILLFFFASCLQVQAQSDEAYRVKTVVIDPGHGGKDPGGLGQYSKEKDVVLAIALKLGKYIEENLKDVKVIYTRDTDKFVDLDVRAEIANRNKADLFISIHANAVSDRRAYGTETFAMGLHTNAKNLEVAMKENAVITLEENYTSKYEGYDPNSVESFIIFNLMQNKHLEQSLDFASYVQNEFDHRARRFNRGVKQAGFIVLWRTTMPSVLIETGFISNPQEERYLNSEEGQDYLASAIFRAFRDYKEYIEGKQSLAQTQAGDKNHTGLRFKVQVSTSGTPIALDDAFFHDLPAVEEFRVNGLYKYAVGSETEYSAIMEFSKQVKQFFPDAFVIAVRDSVIIPVREAREILER